MLTSYGGASDFGPVTVLASEIADIDASRNFVDVLDPETFEPVMSGEEARPARAGAAAARSWREARLATTT
jgi:hypothetical protein